MTRAPAVLAGVLAGAPDTIGDAMSLADIALARHLDVLAATPEGERAVGTQPRVGAFQARMAERPSFVETAIPALAQRFRPTKRRKTRSLHAGW